MVSWLHCFYACGKTETSWQKSMMEERHSSPHDSQEMRGDYKYTLQSHASSGLLPATRPHPQVAHSDIKSSMD
jgi:hypothetical protein